jgi:putative addiction module killer protein
LCLPHGEMQHNTRFARIPRSGHRDTAGGSPFTKWLRALNVQAAAKIATALERIADGSLSNVKAVGKGVLECEVDFGPGYRIYFGRDGDRLVILRAGGTSLVA